MKKVIYITFCLCIVAALFSCEKLRGDVEDLDYNLYDTTYVGDHIQCDSMDTVYIFPTGTHLDIYFSRKNNGIPSSLGVECYMPNYDYSKIAFMSFGTFKIRLYHYYMVPSGEIQHFDFYADGEQRGGLIGSLDVLYSY